MIVEGVAVRRAHGGLDFEFASSTHAGEHLRHVMTSGERVAEEQHSKSFRQYSAISGEERGIVGGCPLLYGDNRYAARKGQQRKTTAGLLVV